MVTNQIETFSLLTFFLICEKITAIHGFFEMLWERNVT